jgi:predicted O-methyltransferase YrrM
MPSLIATIGGSSVEVFAGKIKDSIRRHRSLRLLDSLDESFRSALTSLYRGEPQIGYGGSTYEIDLNTKVSPLEGMWIYNLCCTVEPEATLEVGLAYGFSMLFILAALKQNGHGSHTAIEPFPWKGIAHAKAAETGMPLECIEEISERAAVDLARQGREFEIIFIDGNHRFDNVLIDFTLLAPICRQGGYIILDDMWLKSIRRVARFIKKNRPDFEYVSTPVRNISVFKKIGSDKRPWNHFVRF